MSRRRWLKASEVAIFFPTAAHFHPELQCWQVPLHGWVAEPDKRSPRRAAIVGLFKRYLKPGRDPLERARFQARARLFVHSREKVRPLDVELGTRRITLHPVGHHGHVQASAMLTNAEVEHLSGPANGHPRWLRFRAVTREGDLRYFVGASQVIDPVGVSIVSDIDDTLKVTEVRDLRTMLKNTFLHEFQPVRGMTEWMRGWSDNGAAVHYVTASPWQLFVPLAEFFQTIGLPDGSFHMKSFRMRLFRRRHRDAMGQFVTAHDFKAMSIERLLAAYPRRRFIFVGDSGQLDPEIYGALCRTHGEQIERVYIRNVTRESARGSRMQSALAGVPPERWQLFDDASELPPVG